MPNLLLSLIKESPRCISGSQKNTRIRWTCRGLDNTWVASLGGQSNSFIEKKQVVWNTGFQAKLNINLTWFGPLKLKMKTIKNLLLFSAVIIWLLAGIASAFENEPEGFRGLKWGTKITDIKGMVYLNKEGDFKNYSRKSEQMKIGNATLINIRYSFWQGRLASVRIMTKGHADWSALKGSTFSKFGEGIQPNSLIEYYYWNGNTSLISLEFNEFSKIGFLYMFSADIMAQRDKYEEQKAEEGAETGF